MNSARLPFAVRKALTSEGASLVLRLPETAREQFESVRDAVAAHLVGIEALPILPREIQDILQIKPAERHRWVKDGRLRSAGTRTVKLHGRARKITFHVFDPRQIEELLDGDTLDAWREDDAEAKLEKRRLAVQQRALSKRQPAPHPTPPAADGAEEPRPELRGWAEFERLGLLR